MVQEVIVSIHGVMPDLQGRSHRDDYEALYDGVAASIDPESAWHGALRCGVEWGWNFDDVAGPLGHRNLARAQEHLGPDVLAALERSFDFTINPARLVLNGLRSMMVFGLADVFYYVSADGKHSVRLAVAKAIIAALEPFLQEPDPPPVSLTFVGHSAGAVAAFDFTFYLFFEAAGGGPRRFLRPPENETETGAAEVEAALAELHRMARAGRLRIRRLITLGSPISLLAFRANAVVNLLAAGERTRPEWHGLVENPAAFGEPLAGPRWINVWDKDDPIAWPVAPLMGEPREVVEDAYGDVADLISGAHTAYWRSEKVHRLLADRW